MNGPTIAPTPKKPSTMFIVEVCWVVELEMSPMSASAPVLKMPIAQPDIASKAMKKATAWPIENK